MTPSPTNLKVQCHPLWQIENIKKKLFERQFKVHVEFKMTLPWKRDEKEKHKTLFFFPPSYNFHTVPQINIK